MGLLRLLLYDYDESRTRTNALAKKEEKREHLITFPLCLCLELLS